MKKQNTKMKQLRYGLVIALVIGMMVSYMTLPRPILEQDENTGSWHVIWEGNIASAAENTTLGGQQNTSGILSVYFHPHLTDTGGYLENSSSNLESNCTTAGLGFANENAIEVDLAHSTTFDIVVRVRGNATNCKVGSVWFDTNLRVQVDATNLGGSNETLTVGAEGKWTDNTSNFAHLHMNFFYTNSGSGFTISQDQTVELPWIKFEAYF